jgi:hypothetical protein
MTNEHQSFVHYAEPWEFVTANGRVVTVGLGEIEKSAVFSQFAYLGIMNDPAVASTLLTAEELSAVIDQLTITLHAMKDNS